MIKHCKVIVFLKKKVIFVIIELFFLFIQITRLIYYSFISDETFKYTYNHFEFFITGLTDFKLACSDEIEGKKYINKMNENA